MSKSTKACIDPNLRQVYGLIQAFLAEAAYFSSILDAFGRFRREEVEMSKNALHKREGNLERSGLCDAGFAG